mmetsp:Transcript_98530/g.274133  ORF Transcript_98530/g.274133 Transcript_98530/m.274133 type:complete len:268 (-) Transcript_98530:1515-2318(-)
MGPHGDGAVTDDHLGLAVHEGPCPQVDQHLPCLRRTKVKLSVLPIPTVLIFLLFCVGPWRALPEVVKHFLHSIHPLLAAVDLAVVDKLHPLTLPWTPVHTATFRREEHGQVPRNRRQHVPAFVGGYHHRGARAAGDCFKALPQLAGQRDRLRAATAAHPEPPPGRHEALQKVYDYEPLGGVRPLSEQLLVGQERRHLCGHLHEVRAGFLKRLQEGFRPLLGRVLRHVLVGVVVQRQLVLVGHLEGLVDGVGCVLQVPRVHPYGPGSE